MCDDITYFQTGDDVPAWVLRVTQKREGSVRGSFKFSRPAAVVRLKDRLWMLPLDDIFNPRDFVELRDAHGVNVSASDDKVAIAIAQPRIEFLIEERKTPSAPQA